MTATALAPVSVPQLRALVGQEVGLSDWVVITQEMIDRFAEATLDNQFIHVDPDRARNTRFGSTVAHGFLSLSLLPRLCFDTLAPVKGAEMEINYGTNRLRFLAPVPSGARLRARFVLKDLSVKSPLQLLRTYAVEVEIEGSDKPALVAEWLMLLVLGGEEE